MENLLDYLLCSLFGHNVTRVFSHSGSGHDALTGKAWTIVFEGQVYITLDEDDLAVIRNFYNERCDWLSIEDRARYAKIFTLCK